MNPLLAHQPVPGDIRHLILGSLGGALAVAQHVGGSLGTELAGVARQSFVSGMDLGLLVGSVMVGLASLVVLALLPNRASDYRPERPAKTPSSATDSGVEPDSAMSRSLAGDGHAHQIPLGKVSGGSPASHSDVRSSGSRARVWPTWITASNCSPRRASK